jgi:hypothetical protein
MQYSSFANFTYFYMTITIKFTDQVVRKVQHVENIFGFKYFRNIFSLRYQVLGLAYIL